VEGSLLPGVFPARKRKCDRRGLFFRPVRVSNAPSETAAEPRLPDLVLASGSPRRRQLLERAGIGHRIVDSGFDDATMRLSRGTDACGSALALAWAKAAAAVRRAEAAAGETILAADTICEIDGRLLGKPLDALEAEGMLRSLADREHRTVTAVCLLDPSRPRRLLWVEVARVRVGRLRDQELDDYLASQAWRGKAGGYSFDERLAAGWPIACHGDPEVVLGLPTASVARRVRELAVEACR
jgi:septum formation protein